MSFASTPRVAVLLAGCGHLDGAEVREAVLTLLALDLHGAQFQCIAPNAEQHHVINHLTGQPEPDQSRNIPQAVRQIVGGGQRQASARLLRRRIRRACRGVHEATAEVRQA